MTIRVSRPGAFATGLRYAQDRRRVYQDIMRELYPWGLPIPEARAIARAAWVVDARGLTDGVAFARNAASVIASFIPLQSQGLTSRGEES